MWTSSSSSYCEGVIFYVHACKLMDNRCLSYLAHVQAYSPESPSLKTTRVGKEFMDVFPTDLRGVPLDHDTDFSIEVEPRTKPISIAPIGWLQLS